MANGRIKESEVPLCAFVTLLLTHCYSVFAILDRRVYADEDLRRNYRLEDFLWSGSGDGENETDPSPVDEQTSWERITTVFHTTTVISTATIFYKTLSVTTPSESNTTTECINDPDCIIEPTPTIQLPSSTAISPWPPPTEYPYGDAVPDQRYWLITILKVNASVINFVPNELEEHLAKLYKIAFHRHQEHHLGLNASWNKSNLRSQQIFRQKRDRDRVTVHIHNVTNDEVLKILYSVKVSGHPVLATTAAHDMRLVSDTEVVAELGFPILTKAEPYLKPAQNLAEEGIGLFREKEYLFVVVSSICAAVLVILFVLLLLLTVKKRKKRRMEDRKTEGHQFLRNEDNQGIDNEAFLHESASKSERKQHSPQQRNGKSDSAPEGSHGRDQSHSHTRPHSRRPVSPNSFLSMPSVRDFPTTPLPEPLSSLLNNGSPPASQDKPMQVFSRHGSLEAEDPGVLGPVVWDTHCHRYKKKESKIDDEDQSSFDSDIDVGKVRRRFNELLDDALSLYESHRSPHKTHSKVPSKKSFDLRSQSAAHFREAENVSVSRPDSRPKTSMNVNEQRRDSTPKCFPQPRGAWDSNPTTPARLHSRPLSAGPFHRPTIYPEFITSDAQLSPNDSAVPIISAIKRELDKIPTYGKPSTKFVTLREPYDDHEA